MAVADVPVDLDRDEAREAAARELSNPAYVSDDPNPIERVVNWVLEKLGFARTGEASAQLRRVGRFSDCLPSFTTCVPTIAAIDSQTKIRPNAAHTLQAEKLQRKK